ncbi:MAG: hypothetical protein FJY65_09410 [Calditrichaeota bacterium]|nr:hypothetical protein [Calditrichota bacterium]
MNLLTDGKTDALVRHILCLVFGGRERPRLSENACFRCRPAVVGNVSIGRTMFCRRWRRVDGGLNGIIRQSIKPKA